MRRYRAPQRGQGVFFADQSSADCITNMSGFDFRQAQATPSQIDAAVESVANVGMAMGPCRMLDMAGIDVGAKTLIELGKTGGLPADPSYRAVCQRLYADGRFGQKTGSGYYRYEGRSPLPEAATTAACEELARLHAIRRWSQIDEEEIVERLMLPLFSMRPRRFSGGHRTAAGRHR